jgi:hypothetical protein
MSTDLVEQGGIKKQMVAGKDKKWPNSFMDHGDNDDEQTI